MKTRTIPVYFFDTSAYGFYSEESSLNSYLQEFLGWVSRAQQDLIEVLLIPEPQDQKEEYSIGLGSSDIQRIVQRRGFTFMTEEKWRTKQAQLAVQKQSRLPNPFERLSIESDKFSLRP